MAATAIGLRWRGLPSANEAVGASAIEPPEGEARRLSGRARTPPRPVQGTTRPVQFRTVFAVAPAYPDRPHPLDLQRSPEVRLRRSIGVRARPKAVRPWNSSGAHDDANIDRKPPDHGVRRPHCRMGGRPDPGGALVLELSATWSLGFFRGAGSQRTWGEVGGGVEPRHRCRGRGAARSDPNLSFKLRAHRKPEVFMILPDIRAIRSPIVAGLVAACLLAPGHSFAQSGRHMHR